MTQGAQRRNAAPVAAATFFSTVSAQVNLDNCTIPPRGFVIDGSWQADPCRRGSRGPATSVTISRGKGLFACEGEGLVVCDGDGSDLLAPAICTRLGTLGCKGIGRHEPSVSQVAVSADGAVLFAACYEANMVRRCNWAAAAGAASNCTTLVGVSCGPTATIPDAAMGIFVHPDYANDLVLLCKVRGFKRCSLTPGAPAGNCTPMTNWFPCMAVAPMLSEMHHRTASLDWSSPPKVVVGCRQHGYVLCDFDIVVGGSNCNQTAGSNSTPCNSTGGITLLSSGKTGLACDAGGYLVCGMASPTVAPTLAPTLPSVSPTDTPTQQPSDPPQHPSPHPTAAAANTAPTGEPTVAPAPAAQSSSPFQQQQGGAPTEQPTAGPSGAAPTRGPVSPRLPSAAPRAAVRLTPSRAPSAASPPPFSARPSAATVPPSPSEGAAARQGAAGFAEIVAGHGGGGAVAAVAAAVSSTAPGPAQLAMILEATCHDLGVLQNMTSYMLHPTQLAVGGSPHLGCALGGAILLASVTLLSLAAVKVLSRFDEDGDGLLSREEVQQSLLRYVPIVRKANGVDVVATARHPNNILKVVHFLYQGMSFSGLRLLVGGEQAPWHRAAGFAVSAATLVLPFWLWHKVREGVRPILHPSDPLGAVSVPLSRVRYWDIPRPPCLVQYLLLSEQGDWVSRRRARHWVNSWQAVTRPYVANHAAGGAAAEMLTMWMLGLASAPATPSTQSCGHARSAAAAVMLLHLCYTAYNCPYRAARDAALSASRIIASVAGLLVLAVGFYKGSDHAAAADQLFEVAAGLALSCVIIAVAASCVLLVMPWRRWCQALEWGELPRSEGGGEGEDSAQEPAEEPPGEFHEPRRAALPGRASGPPFAGAAALPPLLPPPAQRPLLPPAARVASPRRVLPSAHPCAAAPPRPAPAAAAGPAAALVRADGAMWAPLILQPPQGQALSGGIAPGGAGGDPPRAPPSAGVWVPPGSTLL
eukprot:TRINITY_DN203_c18_g1_i1.p1 TRINITY_DN203_c18_g1~~TRINITY_DN203_c18_g1_i1.p1  ORF type:complete len:980 (+),score=101.27 TRINITY_DN203_c18_g1_i1:92-3031(+)